MTTLNKLIRENYGSQKQLATQLNVGEHTISRWMKREPENFLKCVFESSHKKTDAQRKKFMIELVDAIDEQLMAIGKN